MIAPARILHVVNTRDFAGLGYYAWRLIESFHQQGHYVAVDTYRGGALERRCLAARLAVTSLLDLRHANPIQFFREYHRLRGLIRLVRPDFLFAHQSQGFWLAAKAGRDAGIRVLRVRSDAQAPARSPLNRVVFQRFCAGVITTSERLRRAALARLGLAPQKIRAIHAPFAGPPPPLREREAGLPFTLGMVARLSPVKGHAVLFEALRRLKCKKIPFQCRLFARPCEWSLEQARAEINRLDLAAEVLLEGEQTDILAAMAGVDVGVICSLGSEANCRAALEWGAAGRPVIATDIGVIPEIVRQGREGLVLAPGDPNALALALAHLAGHPSERIRMGLNFRERVQREFNSERFYDRVKSFLDELG